MIDVTSPEAISFAELARLLPRDGRGRKVSIRTLECWAKYGRSGVRLEATRLGRGWFTTRSAIAEFCAARARAGDVGRAASPAAPSALAEAEYRELEAMGL